MRLSANPDDVAFAPICCRGARVLLNGREIDNCMTADEETGRVYRVHAPPLVRGGEVLEYVQAGAVKIIIKDDWCWL